MLQALHCPSSSRLTTPPQSLCRPASPLRTPSSGAYTVSPTLTLSSYSAFFLDWWGNRYFEAFFCMVFLFLQWLKVEWQPLRSLQWLSVPFAWTHKAVDRAEVTSTKWIGTLTPDYVGSWIDYALLLVFGGIPWQVHVIGVSRHLTSWLKATSNDNYSEPKMITFYLRCISNAYCPVRVLPVLKFCPTLLHLVASLWLCLLYSWVPSPSPQVSPQNPIMSCMISWVKCRVSIDRHL